MASVELAALRARILELERKFVGFDVPLDREPNSDELDSIAAFKLLVHAEIEGFIEARVQYAVDEAVRLWKVDQKISRALLFILMRWSSEEEQSSTLGMDSARFTQQIERCAQRARKEVDENNGIKLDALQKLGCSAGFLIDDLQPTLTGAANSYGKDRGDVAHKPRGQVRSLNGPREEAGAARALVDELERFDDQLINFAT
ncbi:hypothetical protein ACETK8_11690 [Brevundimonas staleyi]|uniref:RiboL-PSP-HEPN domain-containing protein n=1 Tax=Brevundimonas staleyi TaxID=74326 RepID=A0ABW0FTF5_9CAUL